MVVDTWRGKVRLRKWPRKRGRGGTQAQLAQRAWFARANALAKLIEPGQQAAAIRQTKGTGLYPRDLLLKVMSTGMYDIVEENGDLITSQRRFLEKKVFIGAQLQLDAPLSVPINGTTVIVWPLPIIDTTGFWNVASPTLLTIPAGVSKVQLHAGMLDASFLGSGVILRIQNKPGQVVASSALSGTIWGAVSCATGVLPVIAGDWFRSIIFNQNARTYDAVPASFFQLEVKETL